MGESKTTTHTISVARASSEDFDNFITFLHSAEAVLERPRYGYGEPGGDWEQWDNEDEDKIDLLDIRAQIAKEDGISLGDVDNRIIFYELLRRRFAAACTGWRRVHAMATAWEENAQDPGKSYLSWSPYLELFHVGNEQ